MGTALLALLAAAVAAAPPLPFAERVEGAREVERARYAFVVNATKPFDEVYPRAVFERNVRRDADEERVLRREFGMAVTEQLLAAEYERIERSTRALDQWRAMKSALGNDRRMIEEVVCRPLLVDRALRARFAFDQKIHAREHQRARAARAAFLAGKTPPGATLVRLSRLRDATMTTEAMLARTRAEAAAPRLLTPPGPPPADAPVAVAPEMARVLETQLKTTGDVTTILEESDRFSVFRLVSADSSAWVVEAVQVPKRDFDRWFEAARGHSGR